MKRGKNNDNQTLSEEIPATALTVLQGLLESGNSNLAADFRRYRLKLEWETVVGPLIAGKCSPVAVSHGVLFIWVTSSVWMNQLHFMKSEILKKVNRHMGLEWAREIRFTQDKKDGPAAESLTSDPRIRQKP